jgi:hypothetical protein
MWDTLMAARMGTATLSAGDWRGAAVMAGDLVSIGRSLLSAKLKGSDLLQRFRSSYSPKSDADPLPMLQSRATAQAGQNSCSCRIYDFVQHYIAYVTTFSHLNSRNEKPSNKPGNRDKS